MATDKILTGHHENGANPNGYITPASRLIENILSLEDIKIDLPGAGCGEARAASLQGFDAVRDTHHIQRKPLYMNKGPSSILNKDPENP